MCFSAQFDCNEISQVTLFIYDSVVQIYLKMINYTKVDEDPSV